MAHKVSHCLALGGKGRELGTKHWAPRQSWTTWNVGGNRSKREKQCEEKELRDQTCSDENAHRESLEQSAHRRWFQTLWEELALTVETLKAGQELGLERHPEQKHGSDSVSVFLSKEDGCGLLLHTRSEFPKV